MFFSIFSGFVALCACSKGGSSYSSELRAYETFTAERVSSLSRSLSPAYVQYLSSTDAAAIDSKGFAQTVSPGLQDFRNEICGGNH